MRGGATTDIASSDVAATATITFSGAATADETILIIDAEGVSITYTAKNASDASNREFIKTNNYAAATALKACIEHANGHNGSITVADNLAGVLTLTQAQPGAKGNTAITEGLSNCTKTDFTGGAGVDFHARGSDTTSRLSGSIHVPNGIHKYSRKGTWATSIFNAYRNPTKALANDDKRIGLLHSDGTRKDGITGRGSDASLAVDDAATPTRAIPGELTFLIDFGTDPWFTDNTAGNHGGNFKDYSAITG